MKNTIMVKNNFFSELCLKTVHDVRNRNSVSGPNFRTGLKSSKPVIFLSDKRMNSVIDKLH